MIGMKPRTSVLVDSEGVEHAINVVKWTADFLAREDLASSPRYVGHEKAVQLARWEQLNELGLIGDRALYQEVKRRLEGLGK